MKKLLLVITLLCLVLSCLAGCGKENVGGTTADINIIEPTEAPVASYTGYGIKLSLPDNFQDATENTYYSEEFTFLYSDGYVEIFGFKVARGDTADLVAYAQSEAAEYGTTASQKDAFWTISYLDNTMQDTQSCVSVFYDDGESYWTVTARCREDVYADNESAMWTYITSATFE